ncbi:copper resistance protein CopC [Fodinicurvata halophila]|uniref:Copper resistance protein CopC n=1 Tax=Fodinicurvata halophila TaxID=1419723 RepID=A0ABV8UNN5_9PROT
MRKLHTAMISVIFLAMVVAVPALAHSPMKSSTPASGATVQSAPETLRISFDNPVVFTNVEVRQEGEEIPVAFEPGSKATTDHSVPMPSLSDGTYTISWSALSPQDGHVMQGTFSFTVATD